MLILISYLTPKLFCFLFIRLLICPWAFFPYFRRSNFVCIAWPCSGIFWVSLLLSASFDLFLPVVMSVLFTTIFPSFPSIVSLYTFSFLSTFTCFRSFFICHSSLISHPGFVFLFEFLVGDQFYHQLVLLQHKLDLWVRWCCRFRCFLIIYLSYWFLAWPFPILISEGW